MAQERLAFGICGLGFMGRTMFAHLHDHPRARVVAVCARSEASRSGDWRDALGNLAAAGGRRFDLTGVATYDDVGALIGDERVEAVAVALPTPLHADVSVAALRAGRHVICEKPMALRLRDCDRMILTAEATGRTLMIGQCIRFWPQYERIQRLAADGALGAVRFATLKRLASPPGYSTDNWLMDHRQSGGAIFDLHVHDVDFAQQMLGIPDAIQARGGVGPSGGIDHVVALWTYADGRYALLEGGWVHHPPWPFEMQITVHGTRGTLDWSLRRGPRVARFDGGAVHEVEVADANGWQRELDYFIDRVLAGAPVERCLPDSSRVSIGLTLLEKRAAQCGRTVRVPPCMVRRDCRAAPR